MKAPQYRIRIVTNGLGNVSYHPEFKEVGSITWESAYTSKASQLNGGDTLAAAKNTCDTHKNRWLRSQVANESIYNYIPNGENNG